MNNWEENANRRIAEILRKVRTSNKVEFEKTKPSGSTSDIYKVVKILSQRDLADKISQFYANDMDDNTSENERYTNIAVSTISKYENGTTRIPVTYILVMEKIYGKYGVSVIKKIHDNFEL